MKTPIKPEDIRKGDVIRYERAKYDGPLIAQEYRAQHDKHGYLPPAISGGQHFLLDRPAPTVELPTDDHHIGWLTAPGTQLGKPRMLSEWFFGDGRGITASGMPPIDRDKVTEFIPAVAVPKAALERFRKEFRDCTRTKGQQIAAGDRFITAIDDANRGDS